MEGRPVLLEVVSVVALVVALEAMQQLRDPASRLRLLTADAWERGREAFRAGRARAHVAAEMNRELTLILEGAAS